jgi:hypothetical protein
MIDDFSTWAFLDYRGFTILTGEGDGFIPCSVSVTIGKKGKIIDHVIKNYPRNEGIKV